MRRSSQISSSLLLLVNLRVTVSVPLSSHKPSLRQTDAAPTQHVLNTLSLLMLGASTGHRAVCGPQSQYEKNS